MHASSEAPGALEDAFRRYHAAVAGLIDALNAASPTADQLVARTEPELETIIEHHELIEPAVRLAATRAYLNQMVHGPRPSHGPGFAVDRLLLTDLETADANRMMTALDEVRDFTIRHRRDERRRWGTGGADARGLLEPGSGIPAG